MGLGIIERGMYTRMEKSNWKIYIASHNAIIDDMYVGDPLFNNENYIFLNVGQKEKLINSEKYECIKQIDLDNYVSLGKWWAESEGIYNIWRSGIYKELDYIGFLHWDKEFCLVKKTLFNQNRTNITERINEWLKKCDNKAHISLETHSIIKDYRQKILADINKPNTLQGEGYHCYNYILNDYNTYFSTNYTLIDLLIKRKINLCSCFLVDVKTFEKMMCFFDYVVKSKRLEMFDTEHQYRIQGGLAERYFGIFLALEDLYMKDISIVHQYMRKYVQTQEG